MSDDHTERRILENNKDERDISDDRYAPYMTWTLLLWILGLLGTAIVLKFGAFFGINIPPSA